MTKYIYLDDSPIYKDKYVIRINPEGMPFPHGMSGSYEVLFARLLNLSFIDYLRYCRDVLGADLVGKNSRYITPYFPFSNEVRTFVKLLNTRMNYVMNEQKNPYLYMEDSNGEVIREPLEFK